MKYTLLSLGFAATSLTLAQDIQPSSEMPPSVLAQRTTSPEQLKLLVELLQTPALNETNTNNGKTYSVEDIQFIDCEDDSLMLVHVNPVSAPHWFLIADSQGHVLCRLDHYDASSAWKVEQVKRRGEMLYIEYSEPIVGAGRTCEFPLFARATGAIAQITLGVPPSVSEDKEFLCDSSKEQMEMDNITYTELSPSCKFCLRIDEMYIRETKQKAGYVLSLESVEGQWRRYLLAGYGLCACKWFEYNGLDMLILKRQRNSTTTSIYIVIVKNSGVYCETRCYSRLLIAHSNQIEWPEVDEKNGVLIFHYSDFNGKHRCDHLRLIAPAIKQQ